MKCLIEDVVMNEANPVKNERDIPIFNSETGYEEL